MAIFQILKLHVIVEAIWKAVEQLLEAAGKKGGEAASKKILGMFEETNRPILMDLIYNHLQEAEGISEGDAEVTKNNLKTWIEVDAKTMGKENATVRALCRILLLDPSDDKGIFFQAGLY